MQLRRWKTGLAGVLCFAAAVGACGPGAGTGDPTSNPSGGSDPIVTPKDLPVPPGAIVKAQAAGTLPGELEVTSSGQASYTLPLLLPEGRAGMQPTLALHYDGSNRNGSAGVGWSVRGLSQVAPCRKTVARDGTSDGVRFGPGDEYCLDGMRLVAVEGNAGDSGTEYRLEEDRNIKVVSEGVVTGLGTPSSFVAYHPNGRAWHYSRRIVAKQVQHTSPIGVSPGTRDVTFAWALAAIRDRNGNSIHFDYDVVTHSPPASALTYDTSHAVEYYPKQITYTLNTKGLPGYRRVHFFYEPRPDAIDHYVSGVHVRTGRRLVAIEARAPNPIKIAPVWRYDLHYKQSALSKRSLLARVQMCDALGGCLPPTDFQWENGSDAYVARSTGIDVGTDLHQLPKTATGDFNRDGRADLLFWNGRRQKCLDEIDGPRWVDDAGVGGYCNELETYNVFGEWKIAFGTSSGLGSVVGTGSKAGFVTRLGPYAAEATISGTQEYNPPLPIDFDGDGATDLLSARSGEIRSPYLGGALLQTIGSTFAGLPPNWEPDVRYFGDFDGDGRIDLFTNTNRPTPTISVTPWGDEVTGWVGPDDWDEYTWAFRRGTGAPAFGSGVASTLIPYMQRHDPDLAGHAVDSRRLTATMDVDGDGRMELVVPQPAGVYRSVELDDAGNPTTPAAVNLTYLWPSLPGVQEYRIFSPTYLDINGDGLRDVIAANGVEVKATGTIELPARINTGRGFGPWYLATLSGYTPPAEQRDSLQIARETSGGAWPANPMLDDGLRVFDFNSDGLDDFFVPTSGDPIVYVSNGTHFTPIVAKFDLTQPVLETVYDEQAHQVHGWFFGWTHALADFTGDGQADLVQYDQVAGELEVWERAGSIPDKLVHVRNGVKRNESVTYGPLTDAKLYTPGTGCTFPVRCIRAGGQVVQSYVRSAPGGQTHTSFSYEDARVDVQGRGHLGFRKRISDHLEADRTVTVEYGHDHRENGAYPLAGVPVSIRTDEWIDASRTRVDTLDTHHDVLWSFDDQVFRVVATKTSARSYQTGSPPPATLLPSATRRARITSRTFDEFGNLKTSEVHVSGRVVPESGGAPLHQTGTRTLTQYEYENRIEDWLIGLPVQRKLTSYAAPPTSLATTRTTKWKWDALGRIERIVEEPSDPRLMLATHVDYGTYGQIDLIATENSASDPEMPHQQRVEKLDYDVEYLYPTRHTNALGHKTLVTVHRALGVPVVQVDPNGFRVDHHYDGFGRHRATSTAGGYGTTTSYETGFAGPYLVRTTSTTGEESTREYDSSGLVFKLTTKGFNGKPVTVERIFDILGNLRQQSNAFADTAERRWTTYTHDGLDRVTRIDYADGSSSEREYQVDELRSWDQKGNESYIRFDVDGRPVLSADVLVAGGTATPIVTRYGYAPFDLLDRIVDHKGNTRRMEHDRAGNQTAVDDPDAGLRTMIYNAFGELIGQQDPVSRDAGVVTRYERDLLGRITTRKSLDGVDKYHWDQPPAWAPGSPWLGARHATESADGVRELTLYDALGRPASNQTYADDVWHEFRYVYDSTSRLRELHYPEAPGTPAFKTRYAYGPNGALAQIRDATSGANLWTASARDANGRVEDELFGNGVRTKYDFNANTGRLSKIHATSSSGASIYGFKYGYDANGNLSQRSDFVVGRSDQFSHDSLDRLVTWKRKLGKNPLYVTQYEYDVLGNLERRTLSGTEKPIVEQLDHAGTGVRPNALVGYQRRVGTSVVANVSPSYDASGRRVKGPWDHVSYTSFDLPKSAKSGAEARKFFYDADQERVLEVGEKIVRVTLGELYERRKTTAGTTHVFRVQADTGVVAEQSFDESSGATKRAYIHRDHLGSGVAITNASGVVSERRHFTPFGDRTNAAGLPSYGSDSAPLSSGFTGHDHDGALGLIDMRGRVYDPVGSSFMTPDPIVSAPLFGQALNRYAYVWNNPLKLTDPTGLIPEHDESIDMWVDEDPQGVTVYEDLGPADMEFVLGEGACTACGDTGDDGPQSSDADAPPGGDDNLDDSQNDGDVSDLPVVIARQDYRVYARERVWDTMNRGETWTPTSLSSERVIATISVYVTFFTDESGQRRAYFDPDNDVEIAIQSGRVAPAISVTGSARSFGGEPEVAFTISIQDAETIGSETSDTLNSGSVTPRLGANTDTAGVSVESPSTSRTRTTSSQRTVQRGYRARGVIRERITSVQHPSLPARARLPQHGGTPAGLPALSADIRLEYAESRRNPPLR